MLCHDSHTADIELEPFGDQLLHMEHALRGNMYCERVAIETGDSRMRLEASVRLGACAESHLHQQRIGCGLRRGYRAPGLPRPVRECRRGPADITLPRSRHDRTFRGVAGILSKPRIDRRRAGLSRGVQSNNEWQLLENELDC